MTNLKNTQAVAIAKYVRMSPLKIRRVLKQIQGLSYKDAIMLLEFMPYRCCSIIWKVLYSAASNAQNNFGLSKQNLFIQKAFVNQGPILRRMRPRAQGRAFKIQKKMAHLTIRVSEA